MKRHSTEHIVFVPVFFCLFILIIIYGCSKDVITDSIAVQYGKIEIWSETQSGKQTAIRGKISVRIINRTEKSLMVGAVEGSFINPRTKTTVARFRPIIPEAYGTMSQVDLLPKQTKEYLIETPPDLEGFDVKAVPNVIVQLHFTTSDGYRTDVTSAEVPVTSR